MRLTPTTVSTIARPGKIVIHGASRTRSRPSLIMVPQLGNCGGAPTPRNPRAASVEDGIGKGECRLYNGRTQRVWEDVPDQDPQIGNAQDARRVHVQLLAGNQGCGTDDARHARRVHDRERDDDVAHPGP